MPKEKDQLLNQDSTVVFINGERVVNEGQEKSPLQRLCEHKKVAAGMLALTGLAAFLLYEHFKKSGGMAPTFAPDITSTFPPTTTTTTPPFTYAPGGGSVPYFSISQYLNGTSPNDPYAAQYLIPVPLSDFIDNTSWTVNSLYEWLIGTSFLLTYSFNGSTPTNMCLNYWQWCVGIPTYFNVSCNDNFTIPNPLTACNQYGGGPGPCHYP